MTDFYLIYIPEGNSVRWEAMSEQSVPDPGAFPQHWFRKYNIPEERYEEAYRKLMIIRDDMNRRKVTPSKDEDIFPALEDILK